MPTLYVHIGAKKTGTTSIQGALKRNSEELRRSGLFVSNIGGAGNKDFAKAYLAAPHNKAKVRLWYEEARKHIQSGGTSAVITAEDLSDLGADDILALRDDIPSFFDDVKIIYYIRRQDRMAVSHYTTNLKGGGVSVGLMSERMGRGQDRGFRFGSVAKDWCQAFGKENFIIRIYRESGESGWDVLSDFCDVIQIAPSATLTSSPKLNVGLSLAEAALLQQFNVWARKTDVKDVTRLRKSFMSLAEKYSDERRIPRPSRERIQIFYNQFKGENEIILREFFPSKPSLFSGDFSDYPKVDTVLTEYFDRDAFDTILKDLGHNAKLSLFRRLQNLWRGGVSRLQAQQR